MRPEDFDFALPQEQIAQRPADERAGSRLLVCGPTGIGHKHFSDFEALLPEFDDPLVVVNESAVVPARAFATREGDGRRFELLLCAPRETRVGEHVRAWVRGAKRLRVGERLRLGGVLLELVGAVDEDPRARVFALLEGELMQALDECGELPLPPYVARPEGPSSEDAARYQTVFGRARGSVAAPTAGLHFDDETIERLDPVRITLHVGPGTFLPMDVEDVAQHRVGVERFEVSESAATRIESARAAGRPVLAVGTTVTRTLESLAAANGGRVVAGRGETDMVIRPGHTFAVVSRLLTNFHLPRSSLLMLVCAFGGRERVLNAYSIAVAEGYRFYSYGDASLWSPALASGS